MKENVIVLKNKRRKQFVTITYAGYARVQMSFYKHIFNYLHNVHVFPPVYVYVNIDWSVVIFSCQTSNLLKSQLISLLVPTPRFSKPNFRLSPPQLIDRLTNILKFIDVSSLET